MATIKFPEATVKHTFNLESSELITDDKPSITLELKPILKKDRIRFAKGLPVLLRIEKKDSDIDPGEALIAMYDILAPIVKSQVVGWDLTANGHDLPCTEDMKDRVFDAILFDRVLPEAPAEAVPGLDPGDADDEDAPEKAKAKSPTFLFLAILDVLKDKKAFLKN